jgi:hypothetical protein
MPTETLIITGERTMLQYLTQPIAILSAPRFGNSDLSASQRG